MLPDKEMGILEEAGEQWDKEGDSKPSREEDNELVREGVPAESDLEVDLHINLCFYSEPFPKKKFHHHASKLKTKSHTGFAII